MRLNARIVVRIVCAVAVAGFATFGVLAVLPVTAENSFHHDVACGRALRPRPPTMTPSAVADGLDQADRDFVVRVVTDPVTGAEECGAAISDRQMLCFQGGMVSTGVGLAGLYASRRLRAGHRRRPLLADKAERAGRADV